MPINKDAIVIVSPDQDVLKKIDQNKYRSDYIAILDGRVILHHSDREVFWKRLSTDYPGATVTITRLDDTWNNSVPVTLPSVV